MTDPTPNAEQNRSQRPPETLSGPFIEFDLPSQIELLRREPAYQRGRNSKTLARYDDLRLTLIAIRAGEHIRTHATAARITVQTVAGHVRMHAGDRLLDMPQGRLLALDRSVPHDVQALEDSAFLITFASQDGAEKP